MKKYTPSLHHTKSESLFLFLDSFKFLTSSLRFSPFVILCHKTYTKQKTHRISTDYLSSPFLSLSTFSLHNETFLSENHKSSILPAFHWLSHCQIQLFPSNSKTMPWKWNLELFNLFFLCFFFQFCLRISGNRYRCM